MGKRVIVACPDCGGSGEISRPVGLFFTVREKCEHAARPSIFNFKDQSCGGTGLLSMSMSDKVFESYVNKGLINPEKGVIIDEKMPWEENP